MDSENFTYSWGELYETLKEMEQKGDIIEDHFFQKVFKLFDRLDKINSYQEIQEILQEYALTEYEINRINSSCLDGIIFSIKDWRPYEKICNIHSVIRPREGDIHEAAGPKGDIPKYFETIKYYLKKIEKSDECRYIALYRACGNGNFALVEFLVENGAYTKSSDHHSQICMYPDEPFYNALCGGHYNIIEYLLIKGYKINKSETAKLLITSRNFPIKLVEMIEKDIVFCDKWSNDARFFGNMDIANLLEEKMPK